MPNIPHTIDIIAVGWYTINIIVGNSVLIVAYVHRNHLKNKAKLMEGIGNGHINSSIFRTQAY